VDYADDFTLIIDGTKDQATQAIEATAVLLEEYGLKVNRDKCKICSPDDQNSSVFYLGQEFKPNPVSLAPKILTRLEELKEALFCVNLPTHQRLLIFKQCIVTAANYGPLLDVSSDKDAYREVD